jgi:hypothetical protein
MPWNLTKSNTFQIALGFVVVVLGVLYGYASSYLGEGTDPPIRAVHEIAGLGLIAAAVKDAERRLQIIILSATLGFRFITRVHVSFIIERHQSSQKSSNTAVVARLTAGPFNRSSSSTRVPCWEDC